MTEQDKIKQGRRAKEVHKDVRKETPSNSVIFSALERELSEPSAQAFADSWSGRADFATLKRDTQEILRQIKALPAGSVASYQQIGHQAGLVNAGRQVARILHSLSDKYELPWWRVIGSDGRIRLTGEAKAEQIRLLRLEGVAVSDLGKVPARQASGETPD